MSKKYNGSGQSSENENKIVQFPTPAERARAQRDKEAQEKIIRKAYRAKTKPAPFINFSKIPPFTGVIVGLMLLVYACLMLVDENIRYQIFYTFGFVPAYFSGAAVDFPRIAWAGIITHLFIHAGWMHIAFNSIMALTFGILFERAFGWRRAAIFWFACGLGGAAIYFILNPSLATPVVGASGSISGLFGAAILLMHDQRQRFGGAMRKPWGLLGFWLVFMVFTGMISGDNTAWQAHAGGFLTGIGLYYVLRRARL